MTPRANQHAVSMTREVRAREDDATDLNAEEVVEHRARLVYREFVDLPGEGRVYWRDECSEHGQALHRCCRCYCYLAASEYDSP